MVGLGVNQLNSYVTRLIQEGRMNEAAQAADMAEADLVNLQNYQQNVVAPLMQGRGILPGVHSLTAGAQNRYIPVNPSSSGATEAMNYGRQLPQVNPKVYENPYTAQRYLARANQFIENDPITLRQKAQENLEKERLGLVKGFLGDAFKQGDIGFQEGLSGYDAPATFNLSRQDRITRKGELEAGKTTARERAQEPFRDAALQRQMRLKQTPGARAIGSGGGGSGNTDGEILSSVSNEDLGRMEKMLMRSSEFRTEQANSSGNMTRVLNNAGAEVLNLAADKLARMKKKNPLLALKQATEEYKAQWKEKENIIQGADRAANQVLSAPKPNATTPQQQANTVQGRKDPNIEQKISKALQLGRTPEQIKKALVTDGLNPAIYGY
jgi:hypothetical protein